MGKCQCFLRTYDFSAVDRIQSERGKSRIISCLFWCRKSSLGEKSISSARLFVAVLGLCHVIIPVISTVFPLRDAHFTRRRRHIYIITKNDDDDADDVRDDDAIFVFVFWKKQQKEPFDDHHYGEER